MSNFSSVEYGQQSRPFSATSNNRIRSVATQRRWPRSQRKSGLRDTAMALLRARGFRLLASSTVPQIIDRAYRVTSQALTTVQIFVRRSVPKSMLQLVHDIAFARSASGIPAPASEKRTLVRHIIIVTATPVPRSRVESVFGEYDPKMRKSWTTKWSTKWAGDKGRLVEETLHVIDNVHSVGGLKKEVLAIIKTI